MDEIVIVVADLYLPPTAEVAVPAGTLLPGLEQVIRFGTHARLDAGWRIWVARWLRADATVEIGALAPASVAGRSVLPPADPTAEQASTQRADSGTLWLAEPVHLLVGLTSVHLDRRALLALTAGELAMLAGDFRRMFCEGAFELLPLATGNFLLRGPPMAPAATSEPARWMGADLAMELARPGDAAILRTLSTEVQMWLHDHPVNHARSVRGELPVNALWFWGEGALPAASDRFAIAPGTLAFGRDAFLAGLLARPRVDLPDLPCQLEVVFGYPHARRAVLVLDVGQVLRSNPQWSLPEALAQIDRRYVEPAVAAMRTGRLSGLTVLANDRQLSLTARDRFKRWRRRRSLWSVLQ